MERSGTGVRPAGAAARAWDGGGAVSGEEERADAATPGPAAGGAAGASAERVGGSPLRRDAGLLQEALGELIRVLQNRDRDRACCYGLSVSQCHTLQTLVRDGPLTVNELATRLFLDKSTASRLANGLLERGCVGKRSPREDRRVVILQATETGRRLARRIDDDLTEEYAELLAGFDDAVRASLPHLVRRLARVIAGRTDAGEGVECCAQPAGSQT